MESFLRELTVLPLKAILSFLRLLRVSPAVQLVFTRWIWKVGHEMEYAHLYLLYTWVIRGKEEAREIANSILAAEKDAHIAYFIGDLEFHAGKDINAAKQWICKAESMGCSSPEVLLYLKLKMSGAVPEYNDEKLVQKILERNDLSMEETRFALLVRIQQFLQEKKWEQADKILDRMRRIENHHETYIYKWVISLARDDDTAAQKYLEAAEKIYDKDQLYVRQALGFYWLGKLDKAREFLQIGLRDEEHRNTILFFQPYLADLLKTDNVS